MAPTGARRRPAYHFFLACVEVTFAIGEGEVGITRVNSMMKSEVPSVNVRLMGRAQQAAFIQLTQKLNDANLTLMNAVFLSVSHLGKMTEEEFQRTNEEEASEHVGSVGTAGRA